VKQRQKTEAIIREQIRVLLGDEGIILDDEAMANATDQFLCAVLPNDSEIVDSAHLADLQEDSTWLGYLNQAGVDNTEVYGYAHELRQGAEGE
jgi:hypothetical protein